MRIQYVFFGQYVNILYGENGCAMLCKNREFIFRINRGGVEKIHDMKPV